jgi:hypothetical protein
MIDASQCLLWTGSTGQRWQVAKGWPDIHGLARAWVALVAATHFEFGMSYSLPAGA